jgi:hypothetical protein
MAAQESTSGRETLGSTHSPSPVRSANSLILSTSLTFLWAVLVKGLQDKVITDVACGTQHAIALDLQGYVFRFLLPSLRDYLSRTYRPLASCMYGATMVTVAWDLETRKTCSYRRPFLRCVLRFKPTSPYSYLDINSYHTHFVLSLSVCTIQRNGTCDSHLCWTYEFGRDRQAKNVLDGREGTIP